MRLLDSQTLKFKTFDDDRSIPSYAILSHTWGNDEVSYQDLIASFDDAKKKEGFRKIEYCAREAYLEEIPYVWLDTCCIDKSSSSELSEAINSMFLWYKNAKVCYAYLVDVPSKPIGLSESATWKKAFQSSRWFTRGWTLQELLAPRKVCFFSENWKYIGDKNGLNSEISIQTGIPRGYIAGRSLSRASIAQRMSWAATRETTRREDLAYCLLGIFDVNMPMLYGEGEKAFVRLQEEILKGSNDMTIFCWASQELAATSHRGIFAKSPTEFALGGFLVPQHETHFSTPYQMTNKGLAIELSVLPRAEFPEEICAFFPVRDLSLGTSSSTTGIYLKSITNDQYVRVDPDQLVRFHANVSEEATVKSIFIVQKLIPPHYITLQRIGGLQLESLTGKYQIYNSNNATKPKNDAEWHASCLQKWDTLPSETLEFDVREVGSHRKEWLKFDIPSVLKSLKSGECNTNEKELQGIGYYNLDSGLELFFKLSGRLNFVEDRLVICASLDEREDYPEYEVPDHHYEEEEYEDETVYFPTDVPSD